MTWNRSDVFKFKSERNCSIKPLESVISGAAVGQLSRKIENNLKAPFDFLVRPDAENLPEVVKLCRSELTEDTVVPVGDVQQTKQEVGVFSVPKTQTSGRINRFGGKPTLDKYFRAAKTSWRLRDLNTGGLSVTASGHGLGKSPVEGLPVPALQQRIGPRGQQSLALDKRVLNSKFCIFYNRYVHQKPLHVSISEAMVNLNIWRG